MNARLLLRVTERARSYIGEGTQKERLQALWAWVKNCRHLAPRDVLEEKFFNLARESGLRGEDDIRHVIDWALRGFNPFERGPLQ